MPGAYLNTEIEALRDSIKISHSPLLGFRAAL
jgi:hypothetical protein